MSFQQGLSGLNVSSKSLDAIGNNIANSSTVGYKSSAVQFADVYAASLGGGGAGQIGIGAAAPNIAQLFTQGNITTTNNPLDIAINGGGFFRLSDNGTPMYSRNGQFSLDKDGYVVNSGGLRLTGYGTDATGTIVPGDFVDLRMSTTNIAPNATTVSEVVVNLDSRQSTPAAMQSGYLTGSDVPASFTIYDSSAIAPAVQNDQLEIVVDGYAATVTIPAAAYGSANELAVAVEGAINAIPALADRNAQVNVTVNSSGFIEITSRSSGSRGLQGYGSYVSVTPAAVGDASVNLLGAAPVPTAGADNFNRFDSAGQWLPPNTTSYTASTAQTVYDSLGNPHNLTMYFVKTAQPNNWQLYTTLNGAPSPSAGSATGSLSHTSATAAAILPAHTFDITVDGVTATAVAPTGGYTDTTQMYQDLDSVIDAALSAAAAAAVPPVSPAPTVTVSLDNGRVAVTSDSTGTYSAVSITGGASIFGTAFTTVAGGGAVPTLLSFDSNGSLSPTTEMPLNLVFDPQTGASNPLEFTLDFTGSSQYGINFGVNQLLQDGYTSGRLTGISISPDGLVQGRYSNGKTRDQGQIVMVNFSNPNGLQSMGNNVWSETSESGQPIPGTPGQGNLGLLQSAAVEESNVDLTAELVNMIMQQRVYQANAQTIKTQDQILQTLVNLR